MDIVQLKYSTTQAIAKLQNGTEKLWVFFQDDEIPAEYSFSSNNIKNINVSNGEIEKEENAYFVSGLNPGTDCCIEIEQNNGSVIKILTLTEKQSDKVWKVEEKGAEYLALTESGIFLNNGELTLFSEANNQQLLIYPEPITSTDSKNGIFSVFQFEKEKEELLVEAENYRPMEKSWWIEPAEEKITSIEKQIDARSFSKIKQATLRCAASKKMKVFLNDEQIELQASGNYLDSDLLGSIMNGWNNLRFESEAEMKLIAEVEVLLHNGSRLIWNTDETWETLAEKRVPVNLIGKQGENGLPDFKWKKEDGVAYYEIKLPGDMEFGEEELRLAISFKGDRADAFLGEELISDYLYDGTDWVIGVNRFKEQLNGNTLLLKAKAFKESKPEIYFEKYVDKTGLDVAKIINVEMNPEYRFKVKL